MPFLLVHATLNKKLAKPKKQTLNNTFGFKPLDCLSSFGYCGRIIRKFNQIRKEKESEECQV